MPLAMARLTFLATSMNETALGLIGVLAVLLHSRRPAVLVHLGLGACEDCINLFLAFCHSSEVMSDSFCLKNSWVEA